MKPGIYNMDCQKAMREFPDNFFELAIVDPPYGLNDKLIQRGGKHKNSKFAVLYENSPRWDKVPDNKYFDELFRVSNNQIICGANHFTLPPSRGIVCWDKMQYLPTFSRWELLWTSFDKPAKTYTKQSIDLNRFHPTQKPIKLYEWLLMNYAKKGDKILDTHLGSGSSAIAAHRLGFEFWGFELDGDYYNSAVKRINQEKQVLRMFK